MGVIEGLLGGFLDRKYAIEAENRRQAELSSASERSIFNTLLNSPDDETRNLALAGLLDSANPRRKASGLRGWIGETQASPYLERIRNLSPTVREDEQVHFETLPSRQMAAGAPLPNVQPSLTEPAAEPSAGMPPTSPVEPGAPPPTPVSYTQSPPTPATFTRTAFRPRQVVMSPEQKQFTEAIAQARGVVEGRVAGRVAAGMTREEALQLERQMQRGSAMQFGGNVRFEDLAPDEQATIPQGRPGMILRRTYDRLGRMTFEPVTSLGGGAAAPLGQVYERAARSLGLNSGTRVPQEVTAINQRVVELQNAARNVMTVRDAITAAQRFLPNANVDQQLEMADYLMSATQNTGAGAVSGPPAPVAVQPPPAGTTPPPTTTTPPSTTAPPTTGTPAAGGPPKLSTNVPPNLGGGSKETGKPLPPAIARTVAQAKSTNDLIDKALAALEPFKNDTSLQGSLNLVSQYRQGVYDPVSGAASQLADLAGLQSSAQAQLTSGGTRAYQFYIDRRQHVPKLPSIRQVQANKFLPAGAVQAISGALRDDAGTFDSPQQMYEKLIRARDNNKRFVDELEAASMTTKPMSSHGGTTTAPKTRYDPVTKQWIIEQ